MIKIAVDAMGGDNAPDCNIYGALDALKENQEIQILLVGQEEKIQERLQKETYDSSRLSVLNATEVIETGEEPVLAIQKKKDSSLVVGMKLLKDQTADAFVSCGSTGAILVGGQVLSGRLKGVKRSPLAVVMPTLKGKSLLVDCGANVDAKPENLIQFAIMGTIYAKYVMGIPNPTVGLVNIGVEEEKGNALCREVYPMLKACPAINFIGNAEARDLPFGVCDVYVTEAFAGNIVLKMYEGTAKALLKEIKTSLKSNVLGMMGGLLIKPSLKGLMKKFDSSEDGGAPMLGLNGLVVKAHGNSTALQMKNAILQCVAYHEQNLSGKIQEALETK